MSEEQKLESEEYSPVYVNLKCSHFFGYLSQRLKSDGIPPECLTCNLVLDCMLRMIKNDEPANDEIRVMPQKVGVNEEVSIGKPSKITGEPSTAQIQKDYFEVENLGMLYASWTSTVRIPRNALQLWGIHKVKEVEIETSEGKTAKCKVQLME
ncbi:MAG: hypothetical protein QXX08_11285, partial [Candidatus Bathyarchaeia archaeon]